MPASRQSVGLGAIIAIVLFGFGGAWAANENVGPQSGLPLPRFVSLKADKVNVRAGPTREHQVTWVYTHAGLPVEITAEYGNWRRIRDWEGSEGWVYHSLLSGRRTALVVPKDKEELVPLHAGPGQQSAVTARLESGVQASLRRCNGSWCYLAGSKFDGWVEQHRIWGAYPNEKVD
ncbi:MAG: SH3 domain-containing protein [Rhizobiales bacterium]|nr:SH3 domain-containing protein [Hyphomicrobiales bacterium]